MGLLRRLQGAFWRRVGRRRWSNERTLWWLQ